MLGLARRSGALEVGQDRALAPRGRGAVFLTTGDCADAVMRKIERRVSSGGSAHYTIPDVTREELGSAVGVSSAQVLALPSDSGFAKKIAELLEQGARINE
jgi:ribosomal protein L7Ae-like RNA K-turn-binding protein